MISKTKYLLSILITLLFVDFSVAQKTLTLEECRQQALENNKELKKANLQVQEAQSMKKAARTGYLPSISSEISAMHIMGIDDIQMDPTLLPVMDQSGNMTSNNVYIPGIDMEIGNLNVITGSVSVSQPIYAGGQIRTANKMANTGLEITEYANDLKYSEVIELTDNAFWNIAIIDANIELTKKYIEMLTELEDQMSSMHKVGLQPASEQLKVTVQKNQTELQLLRAQNGLKLSKMNLNQILGQELDKEIDISYDTLTNIQIKDLSNGVDNAMANRNELKILENQVKLSEYDKKMTQAEYLPQFGIGLQYSTFWVEDYREELDFNPILAAQISIPIFNWGQGFHKQKAAKLKIQQAQMDLSRTSDLLSLEVLQTKIKMEEAYESIKLAEENIKEAEASLDETKSSFDVGLNTTTELLKAQADWLNAEVQRLQAIINYRMLETTWERVTGNLNIVE